MKIFSHNGIELRYSVTGDSGQVLILLHGFGGGPQDWAEVTKALAGRYRIVVPNLKIFFSHASPLTFSDHVTFLRQFLKQIFKNKNASSVMLCGQSYGATLSLGLRLTESLRVVKHVLINPMPFDPFKHVRDAHVNLLINLGHLPGGVNLYLRTQEGRGCLTELAKVFRIGALGHHEIHHFNDRKLRLVDMAFERFQWIAKNENWGWWQERLNQDISFKVTDFVYSSQDSLFNAADYESYARKLNSKAITEVNHVGHLLVQDRPEIITQILNTELNRH